MDSVVYYRSEQLEIIHLENKPFKYNAHNHVSVYTIGLILDGKITLQSHGQSVVYPPHSYFVVAPYQMHALIVPDIYRMLSICVNKNLLSMTEPCELFGILSSMLPQLSSDIDYTLLVRAVDELYRREVPGPEDNTLLTSALSLWQKPENTTCLKLMADAACYSLYHYIKMFKRHIGMTPHKFHIQNRVRKAQRMIEGGGMNTDIAVALGFYDQSHFIKCFKSIVGLTPTEYRKAVRKLQ